MREIAQEVMGKGRRGKEEGKGWGGGGVGGSCTNTVRESAL